MLSFLRRWLNRSPVASARRSRLQLESLETRDCPSTAPVFGAVTAVAHQGSMVYVAGSIVDEAPELVVIAFDNARGATLQASADGTFEGWVDMEVMTNTATLTMTATDTDALESELTTVALTNAQPTLTMFRAVCTTGNIWTLEGTLADETPTAVRVRLTGIDAIENVWLTPNADGYFSFTVSILSHQLGWVTAEVFDEWNLSGPSASYLLA